MKKTRIVCLLCRQRAAKVIPAIHRNGNIYLNAITTPAFCSRRCAANYALRYNDILDGSVHWCQMTTDWEWCPEAECEGCHPELAVGEA